MKNSIELGNKLKPLSADYCRCATVGCPLKETCLRKTEVPKGAIRYSLSEFKFEKKGNKTTCQHYLS